MWKTQYNSPSLKKKKKRALEYYELANGCAHQGRMRGNSKQMAYQSDLKLRQEKITLKYIQGRYTCECGTWGLRSSQAEGGKCQR